MNTVSRRRLIQALTAGAAAYTVPGLFADALNRKSEIENRKLFWGFDLDVVRAADAPGVSAPNPIGMTGDELCQTAAIAGSDPRTRIVEFTEVNPNYDVDGRTARLTAIAVWHVLAGFAKHT